MKPVAPVMRVCEAMKSRHFMAEFKPMAKEVVFIADDLGMSAEINDAILHAHCAGRLDGAALMMGQDATDEAVRLARENRSLQIGWHLHLTDSQPVTAARWPLGKVACPRRLGHRLIFRRASFDGERSGRAMGSF